MSAVVAARGAGRGLFGLGLALGLSTGCTLSEPYLVPRKAAELIVGIQPNVRGGSLVPALREKDREPFTLRYRHLYLDEAALQAIVEKPGPELLRVRATKASPFLMVGGIILGMGVAHIALGVGAATDLPTAQRGYSDNIGALTTMILGGLHLVIGGGLMVHGEKNPTVEPAERSLIEPYLSGEIPTATAEEAPQQKAVPSAIDVKDRGEEGDQKDR